MDFARILCGLNVSRFSTEARESNFVTLDGTFTEARRLWLSFAVGVKEGTAGGGRV